MIYPMTYFSNMSQIKTEPMEVFPEGGETIYSLETLETKPKVQEWLGQSVEEGSAGLPTKPEINESIDIDQSLPVSNEDPDNLECPSEIYKPNKKRKSSRPMKVERKKCGSIETKDGLSGYQDVTDEAVEHTIQGEDGCSSGNRKGKRRKLPQVTRKSKRAGKSDQCLPSCPLNVKMKGCNESSTCMKQPSQPKSTKKKHQSNDASIMIQKNELRSGKRKKCPSDIKKRNYTCEFCGYNTTCTSKLDMHMRRHTGEKPFECDICGSKFTHNGSLTIHKRIHSGEKPFSCDVCGKGFNRSNHFQEHKRIHTGEKPYSCFLCGKAFCDRSSLRKHKMTHTGIKPFLCCVCGKCFYSNSSLQKHNTRVHTGE